MVIKWKKWNINAVIVYVISVSLLLVGGMGVFGEMLFCGSVSSCVKIIENQDYQKTKEFQDFISGRLEDFCLMACGDYIGYEIYDTQFSEDIGVFAQENAVNYIDEAETGISDSDFSDNEKLAFAWEFHNRIRADKNLLYRISGSAFTGYSNLEDITWEYDSKERNLPEGYNFLLYFDGDKVTVHKDGKDMDIYGDGVYREGEDWALPGYKNYKAKEKWKDVRIVMLAAEEPALYASSPYDDGYWVENELYYIYKNHIEERQKLFCFISCLAAGVILLIAYLLLKKEKRQIGKWFAKMTGRIWFEWKFLLLFVLPVGLFWFMARWSGMNDMAYAEWTAYAEEIIYEGVSASIYIPELLKYLLGNILNHCVWFLVVFWLLYLFVCDLLYNRGNYKNGMLGKLAAAFNSRNLKLPLSKRIVKRFYGVFFITMVQLLFFICMLIFISVMGYRMSWIDGAQEWIRGLLSVALAITVALSAAEYRYQKKNRQLAADILYLAEQISYICKGNYLLEEDKKYYAKELFTAEDPDIRHMEMELEKIRQGLATAIEERISSERMKVELVANVSHDIKTPLTSVISYIQLLKQEENLPEHVVDYIRILDEKSERLKNMVQDVFAVSKAASGQLMVELEELDLGKLLYQTLADMQEEILKNPVTIKTEIPEEPVMVQADGQRMYRVFQNLIGNAVKYSLDGSRVYITLKKKGRFAEASVKNTSSRELNPEIDFSERFIRGDQSRTDGGSGLGLSIAKSFTEACGGTFQIETIADLFVVTVTFQESQQARNKEKI